MFPGFHALQNAVLLGRRKAAEALQPFPQALLPFLRETAKLGIIFQSPLLLIRRETPVPAQPLPGMIAGLGLLARGLPLLVSLDALLAAGLSRGRQDTRRQNGQRQHEGCCSRDGLEFGHAGFWFFGAQSLF
jgi:hypothetical protein